MQNRTFRYSFHPIARTHPCTVIWSRNIVDCTVSFMDDLPFEHVIVNEKNGLYEKVKKHQLKNKNWKKYVYEFLSIFIAVISAFALNNWNDNRNNKSTEQKILTEIRNSIQIDIHDFKNNITGNKLSLRADEIFRDVIENKEIPQDSIGLYYTALFRDYIPIVNKSAYESFKSNNLKIISNDSLRLQIMSLYDYYYRIIEALEYDVQEMQSYDNYFSKINSMLSPYMEFDLQSGNLTTIKKTNGLTELQKKEMLSCLWRIRNNRKFKLGRYETIIQAIKKVEMNIEKELKNNG